MSVATCDHPVLGRWQIEVEGGALTSVRFAGESAPRLVSDNRTAAFVKALQRFMDGATPQFELPYRLDGSPFFLRVWEALQQVQHGEVTTYAALAKAAGSPHAYRAAGSACARNPLALIVPCHRALASGGMLGGYAYGLEIKRNLLSYEKRAQRAAA